MIFKDYYLKFKNEEQMRSVLFEKVPTKFEDAQEPDGDPIAVEFEERQIFRNTDIINLITTKDATFDPESGEIITEAEYSPGFHVNVRALPGESVDVLGAYQVDPTPNSPERVWA